jgi:hypothetical protein
MISVHRLRTGIAAPQAPGNGGPPEQAKGTQDQQGSQINKILRPENQAEQVELALHQVEIDRLPAIPMQPGQAEKHRGKHNGCNAPVVEAAMHAARVDFLLCSIERYHFRPFCGIGCNGLDGDGARRDRHTFLGKWYGRTVGA